MAAGRVLLAVCGVGVVGFAPLLHPNRQTWIALAIVSVCMAVLLMGSFAVRWSGLPSWTTIVYPALVCVALAVLGLNSAPGFAAPLSGMLTLCFTYVGLTHPRGTGMACLPVAATTYLCTYNTVSGPIIVRLLIALFIWSLLTELLARLTSRQDAMTAALVGQATHDDLTGVPNRRNLDVRLVTAAPGDTLVMCDLDHFKRINDTLGHSAGDRVLADFGAMLRAALRSSDYCARYGGEEFLLVLPKCTGNQSLGLLSRMQQQWATLQPDITFSAGVATCTVGRSTSDTLAAADSMLYAAKLAGRDRVMVEGSAIVAAVAGSRLDPSASVDAATRFE